MSNTQIHLKTVTWITNNGNTNKQNPFTEHLSDNSSNQVFDDNLKATTQKNISTQSNKGNYDK